MIRTYEINTIKEVMELISEQEYNSKIDRKRSSFFYRGMPDAGFNLTTSLRMNCKHLSKELEPSILKNFTKYASIDNPTLSSSVWKQMMVGQHHGLPTRLLDWTYSPLIALHFANSETNFDKLGKRDSVIWKFDMKECNSNLPKKYLNVLEKEQAFVFTVDSLTTLVNDLDQYDNDMGDTSFCNIEPPSIDQRIINQYSFFSIIPSGITDIEEFLDKHTDKTVKYIIKRDIRWDIRDMLDQFNVSERLIYPGLDGLSKTLARHYFVK